MMPRCEVPPRREAPHAERRRPSKRTTLNDVAQDAGVSPITVSRALRNERNVDADLVARVMASARKLNYMGHLGGPAFNSPSVVTVLVPSLAEPAHWELLDALKDSLSRSGHQTLVGVVGHSHQETERLLRSMLLHHPAGLVTIGFELGDAGRRLIERSGTPCVHVMSDCESPAPCSVGFSIPHAGAMITDYVLSTGKRHVALVAAPLSPRNLEWAEGCRQSLKAHGLYDPAMELLRSSRSSMALGATLLEDLLRLRSHVDAVLFCSDDLAQGAVLAAQRLRIDVPRQLAIVGFDDLPGSAELPHPLTTLRTPRAAMGEAAGGMLCRLMQRQPIEESRVRFDVELVVRQSA